MKYNWVLLLILLISHSAYSETQCPCPAEFVGGNFPLVDGSGTQIVPAVTIDPESGKYLAAWFDTTGEWLLKTRFFNSQGQPAGSELLLDHRTPAPLSAGPIPFQNGIAYNSKAKEFLIVWQNIQNLRSYCQDTQILGQIIGADGLLKSSVLQLMTNDCSDHEIREFQPYSVIYNRVRDEYVLLFTSHTRARWINVQRFTSSGQKIGSSILLHNSTEAPISNPEISFDPVSDHYLVSWDRAFKLTVVQAYSSTFRRIGSPLLLNRRASRSKLLYVARTKSFQLFRSSCDGQCLRVSNIDANGKLQREDQTVPFAGLLVNVYNNPVTRGYLAIYNEREQRTALLARITQDLTLEESGVHIVCTEPDYPPDSLVYNPTNKEFLTFWNVLTHGTADYDILAQRIRSMPTSGSCSQQ